MGQVLERDMSAGKIPNQGERATGSLTELQKGLNVNLRIWTLLLVIVGSQGGQQRAGKG